MLVAVMNGDVKELAGLIRQDPGFKVNMRRDVFGRTLLHYACWDNKRYPVFPLLLAHPDIDVNLKAKNGHSPFYLACYGNTSCVREMLRDSRVEVNQRNNNECTPLWCAAHRCHLDVIKWWIASGREMDLGTPGDVFKTDAIGAAKKEGATEVVILLERFKNDAVQTKHAMRVELGWYDEAAAEMFALVVFVSDGLLQFNDTTSSPAARYFKIVGRLPLELQMVLCFRQMGSGREIISGKDSDVAFKSLAKRLVWSSIFTN